MYSELVLDHFSDPRNVGEIEDADGVGDFGDAECGDVLRITISVDEQDRITDVRFKAFGCGAAVASSSMATELAMGRSLTDAAAITNTTVAEALGGLPPHKMHCSNMAADALHLAIRDYLVRSGREAEIAEVMTPHPQADAPSSR
jgi:nitrogen fixation NifU-like protein